MRNLRNEQKQTASWRSHSGHFRGRGSNGKEGPRELGQLLSAGSPGSLPERDNWQLDEHWVAVTSYLAEMDFPNEG